MAKHKPSIVWSFRFPFRGWLGEIKKPNGCVYTLSKSFIQIELDIPKSKWDNPHRKVIALHRVEARMLAKRINQCLEATK